MTNGAPSRRYDTVSLLTDYGNRDEFVGVVKSVIRDIAPHAGIAVLEDRGVRSAFVEAVHAATERSRELARSSP